MKCPHCHHDNPDSSRFCGNCAAALPASKTPSSSQTQSYDGPPLELPRGTVFAGRYEVIEEVGHGGMGKVYKVHDNKMMEVVALKLIRPELAVRSKTLERFREEIRLSRRITHKNVCRMHDINEEGGIPYITMEFVPGEDLKSIIRMMGRLSPAQAISLGKQVCSGLAEAHRLGIVHRDLKPKNIMVDHEGVARIMDFGLARSLEEKGITQGRVMIGTAEYMSPEQVDGDPADSRSDIYAFGVILFETVTGKVPFEGDSALSIAVKHKTEIPPDPRNINPQVPESLARMILKCLAKDPGQRYQTATELGLELEALEKEYPSDERVLPKKRTSKPSEVILPLGIKRSFLTAMGLLVLALVIILVWHPFREKAASPPPAGKPSLAVLFFRNNTGDDGLDVWKTGLPDNLITELRRSTNKIKVLSIDAISGILGILGLENAPYYTTENLKAVAAKTKASHLLVAGYFMDAGNLRLTYEVKDAHTAEAVASDRVRGDSFLSLADALAKKILADFQLPVEPRASPIPTESELAYRYYLRGRQADKRYRTSEEISHFEEAVEWFTRALQEDPRFALVYSGLGDLYQARYVKTQNAEDFKKTVEYYETAYEKDPQSAEANAGLGWAYFLKGDNDQAALYYKKGLELEPENPAVHMDLGSFLRSIGLSEPAIKYYTQAIELGERSPEIYRYRSLCYERIGMTVQSVDDAKICQELEPENVSAQLFFARMLVSNKELEEAEKEIAIAEKLAWNLPEIQESIRYTKAMLSAARGEKEKALLFVESAKRDPVYFGYLLSRVYAACGLKDEAIEVIKTGIESGFERSRDYMFDYPFLTSSYFFDGLRSDPRFIEILEKQKKRFEDQRKKYEGI